MRGTYDSTADAAFFCLVDEIIVGEAARQEVVEAEEPRAMVVTDFDRNDLLPGVKTIGARNSLRPESLGSPSRFE